MLDIVKKIMYILTFVFSFTMITSEITFADDNNSQNNFSDNYESADEAINIDLEDGEYSIELSMTGGSGKAAIVSPTLLVVKNHKAYARVQWSSSNYDYMIVGNTKYLRESDEGNSVFEIPITVMDGDMHVVADTTAMGTPYEIDYVLNFKSESIGSKGQIPQEAAKRVVIVALVIIVVGGIINYFVKKKHAC